MEIDLERADIKCIINSSVIRFFDVGFSNRHAARLPAIAIQITPVPNALRGNQAVLQALVSLP